MAQQETVRHRRGEVAAEFIRRFAILVAWAAVVVTFGILSPVFLTSANFSTIFGSQTALVVVTIGLLLPMTAGDYDLSVAGVLSLSSMLIAVLNVNEHVSIGPAIAIALASGVAVGGMNAFLIVRLGIDSLIATLGTGTVLTGIVMWISNSNTITGVSGTLVNAIVGSRLWGVPAQFFYGLALCAFVWYVLDMSLIGRQWLVVGRNRRVARLSGLRVARLRWAALVASGFVAALAGVVWAGTEGGADSTSGPQFLLPAFAAAFLGYTCIMPGRFNPLGSFVAVYFLATGIAGFEVVGVASFVQELFYGGALIVAVALSRLAYRRDVDNE